MNLLKSQRGHAHLALVAAVVVAAVGAVGYKVYDDRVAASLSQGPLSADVTTAGKISQGKIAKCETRVLAVNGFINNDVANFRLDHYTYPEDPSLYPTRKIVGMDNTTVESLSSSREVEVYAKGGKTKKKVVRINYAIDLKRHQNALAYINAKQPTVDTKKYESAIHAFSAEIDRANARLDNITELWNQDATVFDNTSCTKEADLAKIAGLSERRTSYLREMKQQLATVKAAGKKTSSQYKVAAKNYKKAVKAQKKAPRSTPTSSSGGAAAPADAGGGGGG